MLQMNIIKKLKTSFEIKMSNGHGLLCHTMGSKTIVYDIKSWEKVAELVKPKNPGDLVFSRNDDYLYIKNALGTLCVYDTDTFQLVKKIQSNKSLKLTEGRFAITKDPFKIFDTVMDKNGDQLVAINIDNIGDTKVITKYEEKITIINYHQYIPSCDSHLYTLSYVNKAGNMYEYKLMKIKESTHEISLLSHPGLIWLSVIYDPIHDVYIVMQENYKIIIVDSSFTRVLREKALLSGKNERKPGMYFTYFHMSSDGKYIVVTYDEMILILRFEDFEVLRMEYISNACFAEFSDDHQYLLVGTWRNGYVLENNLQ